MAPKSLFDAVQKTIASHEQLETLDRDLSFHPSSPETATTLSPQQVENFNRDGCLMPLRVFEDDAIAKYRRYFDKLLEQTLESGSDSYSVIDPHMGHSRVYDMMFEPRMVDRIKDLLGDNIVCWSTHCFCKFAHEEKQVSWHQDAYYWPMAESKTVSVWLAVDDVDRENACMQFVAGSHVHGGISHRPTTTEERNVLRFTVDGVESYGRIVDNELKAGEMSLHSDLLLHGSGPNTSDRRRCGLTFRYVDAAVQNLLDWDKCGVVVCGRDPNGHWGNPPRPAED